MTVRFGNYRLCGYVTVLLLSGAVLGISAHFASIFLPKIHHDFTIFSLIVPSVTILVFLIMLQWAQPTTEALQLFILGTLWLAMGAWATDIIGNVQCDGLGGQQTPTTIGQTSSQSYCYKMKVIQAFSWMIFAVFTISFAILLALVSRAQTLGRPDIWYEPIRELPWFGEWPGYYGAHAGMMPQYPGYPMMSYPGGGQYVQSIPGQSIVIQPGTNGQPATVTHV